MTFLVFYLFLAQRELFFVDGIACLKYELEHTSHMHMCIKGRAGRSMEMPVFYLLLARSHIRGLCLIEIYMLAACMKVLSRQKERNPSKKQSGRRRQER